MSTNSPTQALLTMLCHSVLEFWALSWCSDSIYACYGCLLETKCKGLFWKVWQHILLGPEPSEIPLFDHSLQEDLVCMFWELWGSFIQLSKTHITHWTRHQLVYQGHSDDMHSTWPWKANKSLVQRWHLLHVVMLGATKVLKADS